MILSRTIGTAGTASFDPEKWRSFVRDRECTFTVWGYSHVFVHSPLDIQAQVSTCKGISTQHGGPALQGLQEVFGPELTRSLLVQLHGNKADETTHLRTRMGTQDSAPKLIRDLSVTSKEASAPIQKSSDTHASDDAGGSINGEAASTKPPTATTTDSLDKQEPGMSQVCASSMSRRSTPWIIRRKR